MDDSRELLDVVDSKDRVIGQATRGKVHAQGLLHRSVHILVFNSTGDMFLQKRAMTKDENPGYWDTSSAGHVNAGEDYLACAHRELMEELGITGKLQFFMKFSASPETFLEHVIPLSVQPVRKSPSILWKSARAGFGRSPSFRKPEGTAPAVSLRLFI